MPAAPRPDGWYWYRPPFAGTTCEWEVVLVDGGYVRRLSDNEIAPSISLSEADGEWGARLEPPTDTP